MVITRETCNAVCIWSCSMRLTLSQTCTSRNAQKGGNADSASTHATHLQWGRTQHDARAHERSKHTHASPPHKQHCAPIHRHGTPIDCATGEWSKDLGASHRKHASFHADEDHGGLLPIEPTVHHKGKKGWSGLTFTRAPGMTLRCVHLLSSAPPSEGPIGWLSITGRSAPFSDQWEAALNWSGRRMALPSRASSTWMLLTTAAAWAALEAPTSYREGKGEGKGERRGDGAE